MLIRHIISPDIIDIIITLHIDIHFASAAFIVYYAISLFSCRHCFQRIASPAATLMMLAAATPLIAAEPATLLLRRRVTVPLILLSR